MKALILAAGYAVRLYPLTQNKAKPLLLVGKKPIISYLVEKLEAINDIDTIYVVVNQKFYDSFLEWRKSMKPRKKIILLNDLSTANENRLGAIGDIELALRSQKIDDGLLVLAGDNMFDWGLDDFAGHVNLKPSSFAMGAYDIEDITKAVNYGVIEIDNKGHIKNFLEKPQGPPSSLVATAIYYFPKDKLNLVSEYLKSGSQKDAPGNFIQWLYKREEVRCYIFKGIWYDIGDIDSYRKANLIFA